jgi:hypothetical protein
MYILSLNDRCNKCGDCEEKLPGIQEYVEEHDSLLISDVNLYKHSLDLAKAIDLCERNAIELKELSDD